VTTATDILIDAFDRVAATLSWHLTGLSTQTLLWRPAPDANSVGWIAWHLARVQDDHVAGVGQVDQVWTAQGHATRFGLPYPTSSIGYGHSSDEVGAFAVGSAELLLAYHQAVHRQTLAVLETLDDAGYRRIVDEQWDPPVTAAVRLVSVVDDAAQHVGQIGYILGLAERRA